MDEKPRRPRLRRILLYTVGVVLGLPVLGVLAFIAYLLVFFNAGCLFAGDGAWRKNVGEATFQVAFLGIKVDRPGRHTFHFTRLGPAMQYQAGFRLVGTNDEALALDDSGRPDLPPSKRPSAVVGIELRNERNQTVFRYVRRLSSWDWLRNMAQIRGRHVEVPLGGGSVRIQPVDVGPDEGWGTSFTPRWRGRYTLTVDVVDPDPTSTGLIAKPVLEGYVAGP